MCSFLSGGFGLLIVVIIDQIFERIVGTPCLRNVETIKNVKAIMEETDDGNRKYALKRLLAESRMCGWWKVMLLIFVAGVVLVRMLKS
jgi:hypothetical protein